MSGALHRHEVVDSTNELALDAVAAGRAGHLDAYVAAAQTAGRGTQGRRWVSARGEGLFLSVVLLPEAPAPEPAGVTMSAGLAVLDAVRSLGVDAPDLRLDWPNDVMAGPAKLSGILVESRGFDPARPHFVVGIGLNVRQTSFPPELLAEREVTSLALLGLDLDVERACDAVRSALAARIDACVRTPERVGPAYLDATGLAGRRVRIDYRDERVEGPLEAIALGAGLTVGTDAGPRTLALAHVKAVEPLDAPGPRSGA